MLEQVPRALHDRGWHSGTQSLSKVLRGQSRFQPLDDLEHASHAPDATAECDEIEQRCRGRTDVHRRSESRKFRKWRAISTPFCDELDAHPAQLERLQRMRHHDLCRERYLAR